jgi:ATP-dependent protease HslVU (ClpYQ) peptidase subunit
MSIIVAVRKRGRTTVASDALYLTGAHKDYAENLADRSKIRRAGTSWIGMTGWSVYQNIFDHYLSKTRVPALKDAEVIFDFFLKFWKSLRERYPFVKDQREGADSPFTDLDASFLVANRYGIFDIHGNMTVWQQKNYCAIGSGAPYAYGALHVLYEEGGGARRIAERAVESAVRFDDGCGGPIEVVDAT